MKLPTRERCLALLKKYRILPNILEHSLVVNKIANYLAMKLKKKGIRIDIDMVDRASLLHDIAKSITIRKKIHDVHHILAEEILTKEGYPELGHVCRMHVLKETKNLKTWEEKVVNYADKRVKHTEIVTVKDRLHDLSKRYSVPKSQRLTYKDHQPLEKEIFNVIGESPDILKKAIK